MCALASLSAPSAGSPAPGIMSYSQLLAVSRPPASFVTILHLSFATNVILNLHSASPADLCSIPGVDRVLAIFLWAQQSEQSALRIHGWETSG